MQLVDEDLIEARDSFRPTVDKVVHPKGVLTLRLPRYTDHLAE